MRAVLPILLAMMLLASCLPTEEYPDTPRLFYEHTHIRNAQPPSLTDSVGFVRFRFTDGDGDLGLDASDTIYPYSRLDADSNQNMFYWNLFVNLYRKVGDEYVLTADPERLRWSRFRRLTSKGAGESIQGIMEAGIFAQEMGSDTFRLEIFIADRALNLSDTIVTEDVVLPW